MWREFFAGYGNIFKLSEPATVEEIESLEEALKVTLSNDLRNLFLTTNGINGERTSSSHESLENDVPKS
jgi:cell wall assembly regulator SMI1